MDKKYEFIKGLLMKFGTVEAELVSQKDADLAIKYLDEFVDILAQ